MAEHKHTAFSAKISLKWIVQKFIIPKQRRKKEALIDPLCTIMSMISFLRSWKYQTQFTINFSSDRKRFNAQE